MDWQNQKEIIENWCSGRVWYGRILLLFYFAYIGCHHLKDPLYASLFGRLNLAIHEAGHIIFGFLGEFIMRAGGTILQSAAPLISAVMFIRQPDYFAAYSVCGVWLATNFYNIATYVADARSQDLPLVSVNGGEDVIHDWNYLLGKLHLLSYDTTIASLIRLLAFLTLWGSIIIGCWMLYLMAKSKNEF